MRLVLYGNFVVDYCSEAQYAKTLESLGHEVVRLQETTITTDTVLAESLKSDALIWVHSHGFVNKGRPIQEVLDILKLAQIPTIAYHLDLYMGLERWKEYEDAPYMKVQHFFTVDKLMADWFNQNTDVKGHYLQAGVFDQEAYLSDRYNPASFSRDVAFVGSKGYHAEWEYRPKLVDWIEHNVSDFTHVGGDGIGVLRGNALNDFYAQTKVVVGDTLCLNFDYPYYWSDRVYETIGRGGFIIHPYIQGMEQHFEDGKHLVFYEYNDFKQLKNLIEYYLDHDAEREKIRLAGHELVKNHHTYKQRWERILNEIS